MKVLHVFKSYFPDTQGGIEEAIRQICLGTMSHNIESRIFTLSPNPEPAVITFENTAIYRQRSWVRIASCDFGGWGAFTQFRALVHWADIVHFHFPWPFADMLNLLTATSKPRVLTWHSDIVKQQYLKQIYEPLMMHTLRGMGAVVCTSPVYAASSKALQKQALSGKIHIIPLGIHDVQRSVSMPDATACLARAGLQADTPFVLFLGVLRYYKGVHVLLKAAAAINGTVVIAGNGPEGNALRQQATDLELRNVVFTGHINDAEKEILLQRCCMLVLPSYLRSEAFGMVLVEAAMRSKPLISCDTGTGTSYVNVHGVTGLVVPPKNPAKLAQAINQLLQDTELAHTMGVAARRRYELLFSGDALGQAYANLYRAMLASKAGNADSGKNIMQP